MNINNNKLWNNNNKIIPFFNVHLTLKKIFEGKLKEKTTSRGTPVNKNRIAILESYLKDLKLYSSSTSSASTRSKDKISSLSSLTSALVFFNIRKTNPSLLALGKQTPTLPMFSHHNKINKLYKNYIYIINKILPFYTFYIYYNSFFKLGLFLPTQLFKPQYFSYKYQNDLYSYERNKPLIKNSVLKTIWVFNPNKQNSLRTESLNFYLSSLLMREKTDLGYNSIGDKINSSGKDKFILKKEENKLKKRSSLFYDSLSLSLLEEEKISKSNKAISSSSSSSSSSSDSSSFFNHNKNNILEQKKKRTQSLFLLSRLNFKENQKVISSLFDLEMVKEKGAAIKDYDYQTRLIEEIKENKKKVIADTFYSGGERVNKKVQYLYKTWRRATQHSFGIVPRIKINLNFSSNESLSFNPLFLNIKQDSSIPIQTKVQEQVLGCESTITNKEINSSSLIQPIATKEKESKFSALASPQQIIKGNIRKQGGSPVKQENKSILLLTDEQKERVIREKANLIKLLQKGDLLIKELNLLIEEKKKIFFLSHQSFCSPLANKKNKIENPKLNNFYSVCSNQPKQSDSQKIIVGGENDVLLTSPTLDQNKPQVSPNKGSKPILNQYLKTMSAYNIRKKGILITYNNQIEYSFLAGNLVYNNKIISKIYKLLQASFKSMYCLISKPVFVITPEKLTIRLFYFLFIPNILKFKKWNGFNNSLFINNSEKEKKIKLIKKQYNKFRKIKKNIKIKLRNLSNITLIKVFSNKFKILSSILSKMFKKPVEFDLIRLHYPYNDSQILVNLLGIMANKIKFRVFTRRLYEKAVIKNLSRKHSLNTINIPAFLSGIKIKLGGRLLTETVIPKKTVKVVQRGAIQRGKINFLDVARYTNKNKKGAFSITIKSGQNIF